MDGTGVRGGLRRERHQENKSELTPSISQRPLVSSLILLFAAAGGVMGETGPGLGAGGRFPLPGAPVGLCLFGSSLQGQIP